MALSRFRNTPALALMLVAAMSYPLKNDEVVFGGGIACLDSNGELVNGTESTTLICVGRFETDVDNSDDGKSADVRAGVYRWANSEGGDEITAAEIGDYCYIVDNETVGKTNGGSTRSVCGIIMNVDGSGVWVAAGYNMFAQPSPTPGGPFLLNKSKTVLYTDLVDGDDGDAEDETFTTALPAGAVLLGARYTILVPFVGAGLATLTMVVGFASDPNGIIEAVDILGDAAGEYRGVPGTAMGGPAGGKTLLANFDPDNAAGLDELTAGSVKIDVFFAVVA